MPAVRHHLKVRVVGEKNIVYADWIASGRIYKGIEEKSNNDVMSYPSAMVTNVHSDGMCSRGVMAAAACAPLAATSAAVANYVNHVRCTTPATATTLRVHAATWCTQKKNCPAAPALSASRLSLLLAVGHLCVVGGIMRCSPVC